MNGPCETIAERKNHRSDFIRQRKRKHKNIMKTLSGLNYQLHL